MAAYFRADKAACLGCAINVVMILLVVLIASLVIGACAMILFYVP
jgi:hypothetical protein